MGRVWDRGRVYRANLPSVWRPNHKRHSGVSGNAIRRKHVVGWRFVGNGKSVRTLNRSEYSVRGVSNRNRVVIAPRKNPMLYRYDWNHGAFPIGRKYHKDE